MKFYSIWHSLFFSEKNFCYFLDTYVTRLEESFGFIFIAIIFTLYISIKNSKIVPNVFQNFIEILYEFLATTINQQAGKASEKIFPILFLLFLFILFSNLLGLIPFCFTVTAHIFQTFSMSLSIIIALTIIGFMKHKLYFLKLFVPSGAPSFSIPLSIVIEVVSYISRAFSLAIRLFANMMSGHTLLNIIASFSILIFKNAKGSFFKASTLKKALFLPINLFFAMIPAFMVGIIFFLELGIAFLQAYVFLVLIGIYLNDSFKGGH